MQIDKTHWLSEPRIVCGLMTGTSLDAVDAVLVRFYFSPDGKHNMELLDYTETPFPDEIKQSILKIISEPILIAEVSQIHFLLSQLYADAVRKVSFRAGIPLDKIDLVGLHGQTVWHQPKAEILSGYEVASTLQLGSVSALSRLLSKPVAGDFRSADIALGGQGAPLVPIFDYEFLSSPDESRIALNIGGMANITYMPAGCPKRSVLAFDTGPGNVLIDTAMKIYFDKDYDENGDIAADGAVINCLLDELRCIPYIEAVPPKSTGRELFNFKLVDAFICNSNFSKRPINDIIRTLTDFTAWSIAENIRLFADETARIIVSGGGSHNKYLMTKLSEELPDAKVSTIDEFGIPSSAKEAICFAYLAYRTAAGLPGNMPSVTGATAETVLGVMSI